MSKKYLLLLGLIFILSNLQAKKVNGYIITNTGDTIRGTIRIPHFNLHTGGFVFYNINLEPFHLKVKFKESEKHQFKTFVPSEIKGFSFKKGDIEYIFTSFQIESESIVKKDRKDFRFLNLIFKGELSIYKNIVRRADYLDAERINNTITYYEYYLFNDEHGLHKVIWSKDIKSLIELLTLYEIDSNYIDRVSTDVKFKNIVELMNDYEKWKAF